MTYIPGIEDVRDASARIAGEAIRTPLLESHRLNEIIGAKVFLKPENLQRTGSFKFRGAFNALSKLNEAEKRRGVVAVSSGNHAQGVAEAAKLLGIGATIIMPSDAPVTKIERTRRSNAEIILYDRSNENRDDIAGEIIARDGGRLVHPFNDPDVIAGQGTCGWEICEAIAERNERLDRVFVCTGGGGLTAGIALSVSHRFPNAVIHPCEPDGFDDYRRSLISGKIETNPRASGSVCDAILTPSPGTISFEINKSRLGRGLVVSDQEAMAAVAFAFHELKTVVEPGGAVALAALIKAGRSHVGETIAVVLSGGNVDAETFTRALAENTQHRTGSQNDLAVEH